MKKFYFVQLSNVQGKRNVILHCEEKNLPRVSKVSVGFDTIEALKERMMVPDFTCKKCGGMFWTSHNKDVDREAKNKGLCVECSKVEKAIELMKGDPDSFIANSTIFKIYGYSKDLKGFGGRPFKIRFNDGRVIVTNNLWAFEEIPAGWNVPDTAEFLPVE